MYLSVVRPSIDPGKLRFYLADSVFKFPTPLSSDSIFASPRRAPASACRECCKLRLPCRQPGYDKTHLNFVFRQREKPNLKLKFRLYSAAPSVNVSALVRLLAIPDLPSLFAKPGRHQTTGLPL